MKSCITNESYDFLVKMIEVMMSLNRYDLTFSFSLLVGILLGLRVHTMIIKTSI